MAEQLRLRPLGHAEPPTTKLSLRLLDRTTSPALPALGRGAVEAALPTAAGLGASAAVLGAIPTGGASLLAIPAGLAAGFGASRLQDVLFKLGFPTQRQAFLEQRARDIAEHPIAATAGEFIPSLLALRPGIPRTLPQLRIAGISGGIQAGVETGMEAAQGEPLSPSRIATSGFLGGLLSRPTVIGRRFFPQVGMTEKGLPPPTEREGRVSRIIEALKAAKPVRELQEALYTKERGKRLARLLEVRKKIGGEAGYYAELKQLERELPKVQFESIRPQIDQLDIDGLFNDVNVSTLNPWNQVHAKAGLIKLFQPEGGQVPSRSELALLNEVFGPKLLQAVLEKRPMLQKLRDVGIDIANLPRAIQTTSDLSAPLRQGLFLISHPKQWLSAFGKMLPQFASESAFRQVQAEIRSRPTYQVMQQAKLALTDISEIITQREEKFMSRLAERFPLVRASNRAYIGFLNKLRADVFDDLLRKGQRLGVSKDPRFLKSLGTFVNAATGRGPLRWPIVGGLAGSEGLERSAVLLNSTFFSPRLLFSRLSLLDPAFYIRLHPVVRREAIKSLLTMASAGASILGLVKLNGTEVGTDPRSADFGKIKVGNTRYDIWGGFQQYIVGATRLLTGESVSSTTGREFTLGEGYKAASRGDIVLRFLQFKEAPVLSLITTMLQQKTITGQKPKLATEIVDRFIPMFAQDVFDVIEERGPAYGWMALPGAFGVGMQTYGTMIPLMERAPSGRATIKFRGAPSMGETLMNYLTGTNISNIPEVFHPALQKAKEIETRRSIALDNAKRLVRETGRPIRVGNSIVYLERGIVKTKTFGQTVTPKRVFAAIKML